MYLFIFCTVEPALKPRLHKQILCNNIYMRKIIWSFGRWLVQQIFVTSSQFSAQETTLDSRDAQKQGNKASCLSLGAYKHIWHICM